MKLKQIGAAAAFCTGVLVGGIARADVVYDFAGITTSGLSIDGVLTLSDAYAPGAPLAEKSPTVGGLFISYTQIIPGFTDLTYTTADEYAVVAGAADPFTAHPAGGDGPLPSIPGNPKIADVYVINFAAQGGLDDYQSPGGVFLASNDGVTNFSGTDGTWTLRASSSIPEPATLALLGLAFAGMGLARRRKLNG